MIQWYPGHIAQFENRLTGLLKLVDVVIEVLDARIPQASTNPRLTPKIRHKPTLLVLNKTDLADPIQSKRWQQYWLKEAQAVSPTAKEPIAKQSVMLYDAKGTQLQKKLIQHVLALGEPAMQKLEAKGRKRRPIRILVAGMPNVGKSTLINSIVGRKKAQTGHRAGVTRTTQWVRIHPQVELMDSPGIIPPQLDDHETGLLLATVSSIGDAAFQDEEVARFLIERLNEYYPKALDRYLTPKSSIEEMIDGTDSVSSRMVRSLEDIAVARHDKRHGQELDVLRTSQALLSDFRHARLGRITLQHAPNQSLLDALPV